ncbi:MAG: hypothetical protein KDD60_04020 [Bdellovibrionales bacterium]|nr:hypothetical protein [Bdellovibrionales bacterium]
MSSSSLFLFDFDGILIDSKKELALTAFNAASRMDPPKVRLEDLPPGFLEKFFALYHLPRNGGEICGLGEWLLQDDQAREYDAFLADLRNVPEDVTQKEREFFAARKLLMTKDEPAWCELNSPIQPLWDRVKALPSDTWYIVTNKNHPAVAALAKHHGLPVLDNKIVTRADGKDKETRIATIMERHANVTDFYFIDDSLKNLQEVAGALGHESRLKLLYGVWNQRSGILPISDDRIQPFSLQECMNLLDEMHPQHSRLPRGIEP